MSSFEDRQDSVRGGWQGGSGEGLVQMPGLVSQLSPADQQPFPDQVAVPASANATSSGATQQLPGWTASPSATRQLPEVMTSQSVTRTLPEATTGALLPFSSTGHTTAFRQPVVIRGSGQKNKPEVKAPSKGRHWVRHGAVVTLVALVAVITLMTVLPESADGHRGFNPFQAVGNLFQNNNNGISDNSALSLISQRAATATAITVNHGPLDPGPGTGTNNGGTAPGSSTGDPFPYGQCTFFADLRYHQVTGIWVPWNGNANQWLAGAEAYGWHVSYKPVVHSIIVLQAYVQLAGPVGHVAFVESINADGSAYTSNMNWYGNGGGLGIRSYQNFFAGSGVAFVYK